MSREHRIFNLARLCTSNEEYPDSPEQSYEYLIKKGENSPYYTYSVIELLNVKYLKLQHSLNYKQEEVVNLEKSINATIDRLGRNEKTISLIENLANIQAYYLSQYKIAIKLLK